MSKRKFDQQCERAGMSVATLLVLLPLQRGFGGTNADNLVGLHVTRAGQFVLCGTSYSGATGNKSSTNSGDYDGWIIGLDANGTRLWDWSYGGTNTDSLASVQKTPMANSSRWDFLFQKRPATRRALIMARQMAG